MTETTLTFAVQRPAVAEHSRFVQRIRRRYDKELPLLPPGAPTLDVMRTTLATLRAQGLELGLC